MSKNNLVVSSRHVHDRLGIELLLAAGFEQKIGQVRAKSPLLSLIAKTTWILKGVRISNLETIELIEL